MNQFEFGNKIKKLRQKKLLTQQDLVKKMENVFTVSYLSRIESGIEIPRPRIIHLLAHVLETNVDELVKLAEDIKLYRKQDTLRRRYNLEMENEVDIHKR